MSKLKRSALKSVVKECLLEILSEGINTSQALNTQPRGNAAAINDLPVQKQNEPQSQAMSDAIAGITSDPILASVLGDTAQTTLIEQAGADRQGQLRQMRGSGSSQNYSSHSSEPDGDSHWAALAFAEKKTI